jgi:hypothetical protein
MRTITDRDIIEVREAYCEACKGRFNMQDTRCWEDCRGFWEALREIKEEEDGTTTKS